MLEQEINESKILVDFTRVLDENARQLPYRKRSSENKKPLHWGQRKLLLNEIEFLTMYGDYSNTVLYVGAANGKHIIYLSILFPNHYFILYDPSEFDNKLYNVKNVTINKACFTINDAYNYANKNILFISDIRNMPSNYNNEKGKDDKEFQNELEINVQLDMEMQQQWCTIIKPIYSLLKFRLPYNPGNTEYLDGELRFQAWAPPTSTETRLIVNGNNITKKIYNNQEYESKMFRFNVVTRIQPFTEFFNKYNLLDVGIYQSYDLACETIIIYNYLKKHNIDLSQRTELNKEILEMILTISFYLGKDFKTKYNEKIKIESKNIQCYNQRFDCKNQNQNQNQNQKPKYKKIIENKKFNSYKPDHRTKDNATVKKISDVEFSDRRSDYRRSDYGRSDRIENTKYNYNMINYIENDSNW